MNLNALSAVLSLALSGFCGPGDGNRLTYLDELNPYYPSWTFPKLTTPQWVGEPGVEAVVVLAIDDMRGPERWEAYLRPIIERLKKIDGRAPVSIMTNQIDPQHPHLQTWLKEGLSLETHTFDHPCPLLKDGDFRKARATYERCVDLLATVPNSRAMAFRMPCCDSLNTVSPRFFAEIFNRTTSAGNFLQVDSSVFNRITPNDPALPRELVFDREGRDRFSKYIPADRGFVNTIEDYPYPYVIGRLCWEFPCVVPSDWSAQHRHKPNNPVTVEDWKAALDVVVLKQGTFNLVFHPHGWIKAEQIVELIDHAVAQHGRKVKFLTFREALDRLNKNLLAGQPLRDAEGQDNTVRVLDVNNDGWMDVVILSPASPQTRVWSPTTRSWLSANCPGPDKARTWEGTERFAVFRADGNASFVLHPDLHPSVWDFDGAQWVRNPDMFPPRIDLRSSPVTPLNLKAWGQFRDLDGDGRCEAIVADHDARVQAWSAQERRWVRLPFKLPTSGDPTTDLDPSVRFVDINEDGHDDVIYSNSRDYGVHLFTSMKLGWSLKVAAGAAGDKAALPLLSRIEASNGHPVHSDNGFFVHSRHLYWQNEDTAKLKDLVDRRSFNELLKAVEPGPKSPGASLHSMQPRPGFEVELVAAEPLVLDPIAFAWGPDAKLWVVEMSDYPLGEDGRGKFGGRVRYLEDSDGDGRYDRSTVFLDGLGYPTGVVPWRSGVLVTCAPEIFYAEDTNGDGRADVRRTLFSGFGEGNQQHRVNGLVWGLDNWVYCANGDSGGRIKSHGPLVNEQVRNPKSELQNAADISGRDFRIRPDTGELDPQTGQTQFGRAQDDWGNWFGGNNSNPMYHFVLADHYTRRNPHVAPPDPRVHVSVTPGAAPVYPISRTLARFNDPFAFNRFTSANSVIVYRDDLFGPGFEGNAFVSEPVHNLVHRELMAPRGVTFTSRRADDEQQSEFLASSDNWFRPTMIRVGPDGALWIADMYRHVIEHPEWIPKSWQEKLDLRAGHDRGRIYRVHPVGKTPRPVPRLDRLSTTELVAALDSPSGWQRDMVQMMLVWRQDNAAVAPLEKLVTGCPRPQARLHALCTLDGMDAVRDEIMLRASNDPHPGVRRHAVRLSGPRAARSAAIASRLVELAGDSDLHVRMQLAYTLGDWDDPRAGRALGQIAARDATDRYITAAVLSSATSHVDEILAAVLAPNKPAAPPSGTASPATASPPTELLEKLIGLAVAQGNDDALARVLELIAAGESARPKDGGTMGKDARPTTAAGFANWQFTTFAAVLDALDRRNRSLAALGARRGSLKVAVDRLAAVFAAARARAADPAVPPADRIVAVRLLGRGPNQSADDVMALAGLLTPQTTSDVQLAAVAAMGRLRDDRVPTLLVTGWRGHSPGLRGAILDVLLGREPLTRALLDRIEHREIPAAEIGAVHRQRLLQHQTPALRDRAAKLLGTAADASRTTVLEQYRPALADKGDVTRGAAVFKRVCAACHKLAGMGTEIGPDLHALSDRSPASLLTAILDPNRAVEAKFVSYAAATKDGRIFSGMLAAETGNSITLVAQEGKRETILRTELEELQSTGKSLMPDGVERDVTVQEMTDLIAFLGTNGPPRKVFERNKPDVVRPDPLRGELFLTADNGEIYGDTLVYEDRYGNLGYWQSPNDHAIWSIEVTQAGRYTVTLHWACDDGTAGNTLVLETGDQRLSFKVPGTGTWDTYRRQPIGTLTLPAGTHRLVARPESPPTGAMIDLRDIKLTRIK
jgi:putative membrane-bound dehydrogenase-like protein